MEGGDLIGIQGSGKSTFCRERFFDTHVRINLDLLRTWHREKLLLTACLESRQRFVVDNTNVAVADRRRYYRAGEGKRVHRSLVIIELRRSGRQYQ